MTTPSGPRIALRADADGSLDDVVVRDVDMFRAEMMSDDTLWLGCYLEGTGVEGDRVGLRVTVQDGRLRLLVDERPQGEVAYE